ncbi:ATP-binding cassette domain-containing protein [Corynebacterium sp.]|uniref:ATP-binding cassette domain-containing protein n=1 Tax=Corynebacterium sp. TaxID=1720 RepID=UPI0026DA7655|nr:ATP-binding cassette domain-containing protein [Corynebacterium sp.]MDO5032748.1 ATP-binding cassette domain-containing protein [Corynebacterium sp.]
MIEFDDVTVRYPGSPSAAVEGFSYTLRPGAITALVGPSGCGKTTLLRLVNRMVEPSSGRVLIEETPVTERDPVQLRRSIGYVMQNSGLLPHCTALENVAAVARLSGASRQEATAAARQWLLRVHVGEELHSRYPAELSGGQAQRVGVARGLVANPQLVLMDEPFGAVDPVVRRELQHEVRELQRTMNTTVLLVTHDMDEAFLLGDDIILLGERAHIRQHGAPEDFLTAPASPEVAHFVGLESKRLHVEHRAGRDVLVGEEGTVVGLLDSADNPSTEATHNPHAGDAR